MEQLKTFKGENKRDKLVRIQGKNPFLWPDHWEIKDYVRIFQCMVLTSSIMSDVQLVSSRLNTSYAAVHMRIEDWMIHYKNTEKRALQKDGRKLSICTSKVEIIQRVSRIKVLSNRALPLYLAVADDLLVNSESSVLDGWGGGLVPFEKKKLGVLETYAKHPYLVQAAMDYEICSRADVFVGNSFSTFSSLVVSERSLRHLDSCNISFAYNMAGKDGSARGLRFYEN